MLNLVIRRQRVKLCELLKSVMMAFRHLYRLEAIVTNLIALGICGFIAVLLQTDWLLPHPTRFHHYFVLGLEVLAALHVIKSSSKSLLLPTLCLLIGGGGLFLYHFKFYEISITVSYLQTLVMIGSIGACIAVLNIE